MQSGGLEFGALHAQSVDQHTHHQGGFLLLSVAGAIFEEFTVVVGLNGPAAHCKAELDISLYFPGVGGSVEQSELHCALGEESVEIDTMISRFVVVLMVDGSTVPVVYGAIPDALSGFLALFSGGFH